MNQVTVEQRYEIAEQANNLCIDLDVAFIGNGRNMQARVNKFDADVSKVLEGAYDPKTVPHSHGIEGIHQDVGDMNLLLGKTRVEILTHCAQDIGNVLYTEWSVMMENFSGIDTTWETRRKAFSAEKDLYKSYGLFGDILPDRVVSIEKMERTNAFIQKYQHLDLSLLAKNYN